MSNTFENLEVWSLWRNLVNKLWKIFYDSSFKNYWFQDQIMRAAISITNNIAEWRERPSNKDFIKFLYYSKWSTGEVRSMLYLALDFWFIDQEMFEELKNDCTEITIKLYYLIKSLI